MRDDRYYRVISTMDQAIWILGMFGNRFVEMGGRAAPLWAASSAMMLLCLNGCGSDDCAPHLETSVTAPGGQHVTQRLVAIHGAPGATVTDLITVEDRQATRPRSYSVLAFEEEQGNGDRDQVTSSWTDEHHL